MQGTRLVTYVHVRYFIAYVVKLIDWWLASTLKPVFELVSISLILTTGSNSIRAMRTSRFNDLCLSIKDRMTSKRQGMRRYSKKTEITCMRQDAR